MSDMVVAVKNATERVMNDIQSKSKNNLSVFKSTIIQEFSGTEDDYSWIEVSDAEFPKFFGSEVPEGKVLDYDDIEYSSETETFTFRYKDV